MRIDCSPSDESAVPLTKQTDEEYPGRSCAIMALLGLPPYLHRVDQQWLWCCVRMRPRVEVTLKEERGTCTLLPNVSFNVGTGPSSALLPIMCVTWTGEMCVQRSDYVNTVPSTSSRRRCYMEVRKAVFCITVPRSACLLWVGDGCGNHKNTTLMQSLWECVIPRLPPPLQISWLSTKSTVQHIAESSFQSVQWQEGRK
jgi:hypothetical protein